MPRLDLPPFLQFVQRQTIRRIAVDLVGGSKNERRFWRKLSRCLEQIQRAVGVYGEIGLRIACSPVVRRLRRGMHDYFDGPAVLFEQLHYCGSIPNINMVMFVTANVRKQIVSRFFGGSLGAK